MRPMKILILGSQGNLGQDLVSVFSTAGHEVVGCDRDELDVTDEAAVRAMIGRGFSAVINAVAYNNVDRAEDPNNPTRSSGHPPQSDATMSVRGDEGNAGGGFRHFRGR